MSGKKPTEIDGSRGERIRKIREEKGLTQTALAKGIGVSRAAISLVEAGNAFTLDNAIKIANSLDVSLDYLLRGERNANRSQIIQSEAQKGIAYYNMEVSAGPIEMFQDESEVAEQIFVPGFNHCDVAINVWGDSMYPAYKPGTIILCKELFDKSQTQNGEPYLVITKEYRTIKYVHKSKENPQNIILRSENASYPDTDIELDKVIHIYHVLGKIERTAI